VATSADIVSALSGWFEDISGLTVRTGVADSLEDTPLLEVYPEAWAPPEEVAGTRKTTFGAAVQPVTVTVHADLYAEDAKWASQRMEAVQKYADLLIAQLQTIKAHPILNEADVIRMTWRASRVGFQANDVNYAGVRFVVEVTYK
jgi:hypothetical protein